MIIGQMDSGIAGNPHRKNVMGAPVVVTIEHLLTCIECFPGIIVAEFDSVVLVGNPPSGDGSYVSMGY